MIEPKMATMLAYLMTDAAIKPPALRAALERLLPHSFNAITVDGDMSTNDTLILMASGAAAIDALARSDLVTFERARRLRLRRRWRANWYATARARPSW